MNTELERFVDSLQLSTSERAHFRWRFVHACAARVRHLLEESEVIDCVHVLGDYVDGRVNETTFAMAQSQAAALANRHRGSRSIDGCGHAAVSASYAVANALAGKPIATADYAAYAMVYAQGGAAAVADRDSFASEFAWQVETLKSIVEPATV